jgi:ATP-binding cassette subfamily B protein
MHYGHELTIVKLRELLGTDITGTTVKGIVEALPKLGFEAKAVRVDKDAFLTGFTTPAIARLVKKDGTTHFVVIYKVNGKKETLVYMDPAESKIQKKKVSEFFEDFEGILILMLPNDNFTLSKDGNMNVFSSFISLIKPHWKMFAVAIAVSVILTVFGVVMSMFNRILIDEIIPYNLDKQLTMFAVVLVLVVLTQTVLGALRQHVVLYISQKIDIPLVLGYFGHVFRLPMNFFASRKTGDIVTRFQDAGVVKSVLTNTALTVMIDVAMISIVSVVLYSMNVRLFAIVVALAIVSAVLIFLFRRPYRKLNKRSMEQGARLNSQIIESLNGIETVKTNSSEERVMEKIETEYIKALKIAFEGGVLSNIQTSASSFVGGLGNIGLLVIGGFMVISGSTTLGTLVAFMSLAGFFIDPINRLVGLQLSIQEANISLRRLAEIYDVDEEEDTEKGKDVSIISNGIQDVDIENISFRYGSRPLTLKNVSIKIPQGNKVAIVGRSGSGKTTLSKILLKFYTPEEGSVLLNGINIKDIDAFALRTEIGCVPQNVELFSGSVSDNIVIGNPDATPSDVDLAGRRAGCDEFVRKLPAGYNTFLDEDGGGLSGGEKQRIALARALIKQPSFIILDEATSNMDFITEQLVYDTIFNKLKDTTIMIIAHRLSTIRRCDTIYVMDNGKIVESGTHDELLSKAGAYAEMWNSQVGPVPGYPATDAAKSERHTEKEEKNSEDDEIEYG